MIKFGDTVLAVDKDGSKHRRIYLGTKNEKHFLVYGAMDEEEVEQFNSISGAPIGYWVDKIEEIVPNTIDVGLDYEDLFRIGRVVTENITLEHEFLDHDDKPVKVIFMSKDEAKQRGK